MKKWEDLKAETLTPERIKRARAKADAAVLEMNLRALREAAGKTQAELAELADIGQSELSRIEQREDHLLSTLRRYIDGLGGELEVHAILGGKRVKLVGV